MAFLVRASASSNRPSASSLEDEFLSGQRRVLFADAGVWQRLSAADSLLSWTAIPYPAAEASRGRRVVGLSVRALYLPRGAPHRDLATQLLADIVSNASGLPPGASQLAAQRESYPESELSRLADLGQPLSGSLRRAHLDVALSHAVAQALGRKRNPEQAIADARASLDSESVQQ